MPKTNRNSNKPQAKTAIQAISKSENKPQPGLAISKQGRNHTDTVEIAVVGDIFIETFLWPRGRKADRSNSLPYTWPDELRSSNSMSRFRELSGAPLHAKIYGEVLSNLCPQEGANRDWTIKSYPSYEKCEQYVQMIDGGPFPIYLHELAAFKKSKQGHQSNQKVWRILKSHGEITEQPFKEDAAIKLIAKLSKSVNDWIDTIDTSSKQVIIINDRDAIKCGLEQTSVRKQLREILKKKGESQSRVLSRNLSRAEINKHKLVIWQTRVPLFKGDDVYSFLESKDLLGKTIPIINYGSSAEFVGKRL